MSVKLEQYQFPTLSQEQNSSINYLIKDVNNDGSPLAKLNKYSDTHDEFDIRFRGDKMTAIGSERAYEFIVYLANNKIEDHDQKYKAINKVMERLFPSNAVNSESIATDTTYSQLYQQEFVISRLLIALIDRHFFDNSLRTWGWDDRVQIIWGSHHGGVSASTMRYGNHTIIKVNLFAFVSWINDLKIKDGKSLGNNNCRSIIDCIVKTVCHEMVHFILQQTPCIIDKDKGEILIRSKSIREHYKLKAKYTDKAYIPNSTVPYFAFGQLKEGPGSSSLTGSDGGHLNTFMCILINWFGQSIPQHNLYTVNYQPLKLKF